MTSEVCFSHKASKQVDKLPKRQRDILVRLVKELQIAGPVLPSWQNYSTLVKHKYHCHLSYKWVACWQQRNSKQKPLEIYYVGSRENAPY